MERNIDQFKQSIITEVDDDITRQECDTFTSSHEFLFYNPRKSLFH